MRTWTMHWSKVIVAILGLLAPAEYAMAQADALAYETIEPARIKLGESATLRVTSLSVDLKNVAVADRPRTDIRGDRAIAGSRVRQWHIDPATYILIRVTPQFAGVFSIPGLTPKSAACRTRGGHGR